MYLLTHSFIKRRPGGGRKREREKERERERERGGERERLELHFSSREYPEVKASVVLCNTFAVFSHTAQH